MPSVPCHQYFETAAGDWEGDFLFEITDGAEFKKMVSVSDRVSIRLLLVAQAMFGLHLRIEMGTRNHRTVKHFFELVCGGVVLYRRWSNFRIDFETSGTVEAEEAQFPLIWKRRSIKEIGTLRISDNADQSHYVMHGFGAAWEVEMKLRPDRAISEANCLWGRLTENLHRPCER